MSDGSTSQTEQYPAEPTHLNTSHYISPTFSIAMNGSACIFQLVFLFVFQILLPSDHNNGKES
jgi:hypothetical protein